MKQAHLLITGKVQGVGYRYHTVRQSEKLGLRGWVRNLPSGDVEVVLEGETSQLEAMIAWCHQGPPSAGVRSVAVTWQPAQGFDDFQVR